MTCAFVVPIGFLESLDDFYILSSGLILLQTTNSVYNKTLLKLVVPETLLAWQRVRVANMMAEGGKDWAEIFSKYNSGKWFCSLILRHALAFSLPVVNQLRALTSYPAEAALHVALVSPNILGTYNNQYMVLDLKRVKLNKSLDEGTLFIVEQVPTYVEYSEQTNVLRKGTFFLLCQEWVSILVAWFPFCPCDSLRKSSLGMENSIPRHRHRPSLWKSRGENWKPCDFRPLNSSNVAIILEF